MLAPTRRPTAQVTVIASDDHATTRNDARVSGHHPRGRHRAEHSECDQRGQRRHHDPDADRRERDRRKREQRPDGELGGRGRRGLQRSRDRDVGDAELVTHVCAELVVGHELIGDEARARPGSTPRLSDLGELPQLRRSIVGQRLGLDAGVGFLGVALRAHRDVLAHGHRHRAARRGPRYRR